MSYLAEPLTASFNKSIFNCGKPMLDNYIHTQATQDIKRQISACFVIAAGNKIKGYYTLSNSNIPQEDLPENVKKKMPKAYANLPTTLLGRLAVDLDYKGRGVGKMLLIDALKRSFDASKTIASMAVVVDPLDKEAENFYTKYGFILLPDSGKMFIAMKTIEQLF
ncbi:MAG: GNAT family N-acetyltransferase [Sphingobacteriales bacterium JAD_PAG50586_3]|nr:MAG: GNAT family N-acetyltransferase [Sphingobacteriales bacterium JAD_PAG50586_3]